MIAQTLEMYTRTPLTDTFEDDVVKSPMKILHRLVEKYRVSVRVHALKIAAFYSITSCAESLLSLSSGIVSQLPDVWLPVYI